MTTGVDITVENGIGHVTLARPEALHALNGAMCESILAALTAWKADPTVFMVLIDHQAGTRGFCAGGDIRMLATSGADDAEEARAFFNVEYRMNVALQEFPKPVVALMDGVTMGGGVGLSVHGSHRVATERTLFAMPETGIGLFPDVGGGWFLPRLRGELGTWLALTGARLKGQDVVAAGIGTHFVPSELLPNFAAQLLAADLSIDAAITIGDVLKSLSQPVGAGSFDPHMETINTCFASDDADTIAACLAKGDDWAKQQLEVLRSKSPETVKVSLRQLREGARLTDFRDNMRMEYRIGWRKVQSHDFQEGVRAVIIDKDNAPEWSPKRIEDVREEEIEKYFAPLGKQELTF